MDVRRRVFDERFETFLRIFLSGVEEEPGSDGPANSVEVSSARSDFEAVSIHDR